MAESKRDYYEVLGVSKDADEATLKKAYRQVAKKYHPDVNPGDAEAEKKFKEASEAYAILSDPEKRRQYDQFGHAAFEGGAGGAGGFGGFDFNGADFSDIFGDIFGDLFGGGGRRGRANQGPMKGMNIRKLSAGINIPFPVNAEKASAALGIKGTFPYLFFCQNSLQNLIERRNSQLNPLCKNVLINPNQIFCILPWL